MQLQLLILIRFVDVFMVKSVYTIQKSQEVPMWIDYTRRIPESVSELAALERRLRGRPTADRVKMLRLLKSGAYRSRRALAPVLGYCERQLQRWWATHQAGGLPALLEYQPRGGQRERLPAQAWTALEAEMEAGRIARLKEAQAYLKEHWGITYHLSAVARLFRRRKVKLKTGRRRHRRASAQEQTAFKKSSGSL